jgi:DNA mismatch repair protein MutS
VALITIMAQMGSFVPADAAEISICDRIFTRVGASDDLTAGQSTFMVEMSEVASILQYATPRSLVLLDEIGRGTSTFDGMSIAKAVVEYILTEKKLGCKTLFATHYHELTEMEQQLPGIVNYNIAVRRKGDDIIFLRKIVRGGTDDSFGIEVAGLAGVPQKVIRRAKVILRQLEESAAAARQVAEEGISKELQEDMQVSMSERQEEKAVQLLRQADIDSLSPRDALDFLYEIKKLLI